MGFSFRRSVKLGPLRVNFSTRGVGVSTGVRGARVSIGPRGTYVTLGREGFQYRAKLDNRPQRHAAQTAHTAHDPVPGQAHPYRAQHDPGYIHSAAVETLALSSPDASLNEIQRRLTSFNWFYAYLVVAGFFLFVCLVALPIWATFIMTIFAVGAAIPVYLQDSEYRTARLIYDVDDPAVLERLAMCNGAAEWLGSAARIYHIYHSMETRDWKTNAGASTLIRRTPTRIGPGALPRVELNIGVYSVPVGPQHILFLPDRVIVRQGRHFAAVPYEHLFVEGEPTRFIEDGSVPPDTQVVDTTWQFVNKSGGPDLRFNNNRQLPVCRYGELTLATSAGLRVILQTSTAEAAIGAAQALGQLRARALEGIQAARPAQLAGAGGFGHERALPPPQAGTGPPLGAAHAHGSPLPAPNSPETQQPAQNGTELEVHRAAAILLRYIAAADRRIEVPPLPWTA